MADKTLLSSLKSLLTAAKAMPDDLEDIEDVLDIWNEKDGQHKLPAETEIKTGPREESSGDGAFKMVGEYSKPDAQSVMVERYNEMSRWFDKAGRAMKALKQNQDVLTAALFEAVKSETATAAPTISAEDSYLGKARSKLKVAKTALRKADMADEDEDEEREEEMEKAQRALANAKRLLSKAEDEEDEDEVEKAFADLKKLTKAFAKAQSEFAKAEDEDEKKDEDEDEDETKKSAEPVASDVKKADDEDEKKDEDDKEDETKKATDRLKMLELKVEDVLNVVAGKSRFTGVPDMIKAIPTETVGDRIEKAIDDGTLSEQAEIMKAQDLHLRLQAAQAGQYDGRRLQSDIEGSSDNIRNLFQTAA